MEAPAKFNMKMYPMSAKDQEAENKFLDENIEKGYIVPSDSPYGVTINLKISFSLAPQEVLL